MYLFAFSVFYYLCLDIWELVIWLFCFFLIQHFFGANNNEKQLFSVWCIENPKKTLKNSRKLFELLQGSVFLKAERVSKDKFGLNLSCEEEIIRLLVRDFCIGETNLISCLEKKNESDWNRHISKEVNVRIKIGYFFLK